MFVAVFATLINGLGFDLDTGIMTEAVFLVLQGAGALLWIAGQMLRKDLSWGIFRKK